MNRSILTLLAADVCLSASGAVWAAPAPKIVCAAPEFNFGAQDNEQTIEHDFLIRNDGDMTLDIRAARPSCGCTVANISAKMVEPGHSTVITARLNLVGREGPQNTRITVESNDPATPVLVLSKVGEAVPSAMVLAR